jgi:hypothetical protein
VLTVLTFVQMHFLLPDEYSFVQMHFLLFDESSFVQMHFLLPDEYSFDKHNADMASLKC